MTVDLGLPDWPIPLADFTLEPAKTALVLIDMQEMLCCAGVGLCVAIDDVPSIAEYFYPRVAEVLPNQQRLLEHFRQSQGRVVHVTIGPNAADGSDLTPWRRRRNERLRERLRGSSYPGVNQAGHRIVAELAPLPEELVLNKPTMGAFTTTPLDFTLRNWGISQVVFAGEATNACVYTTAVQAADLGYESAIAEDASAAWSEELHLAALRNFALLFGRVMSTDDVLAELLQTAPVGAASA
ncbi:MAG TPA: cysteine hydrolase [Gaiellaceae bacterium]|nr:cysteine hydrolase [Gaiellaceae bacterium]